MFSLLRRNIDLLLYFLLVIVVIGGAFTWWQGRQSALTIRWTTESELDIVAFNLYRADAATADYRRINEAPIPAATDPVLGGDYAFVDEDVVRGQTYYYALETVDRFGNVRRRDPEPITAR